MQLFNGIKQFDLFLTVFLAVLNNVRLQKCVLIFYNYVTLIKNRGKISHDFLASHLPWYINKIAVF